MAKLRELFAPDSDVDTDDLSGEIGCFVSALLDCHTPASAELAAKVYRLCCEAWHRNRLDVYGYENMTDEREQSTARAHADVLYAMARAEAGGFRTLDELADEMPETQAPTANVVQMGAWLDSHPRPVRNLLFAEKGAGGSTRTEARGAYDLEPPRAAHGINPTFEEKGLTPCRTITRGGSCGICRTSRAAPARSNRCSPIPRPRATCAPPSGAG